MRSIIATGVALLAMLQSTAADGAVELTESNFKASVGGKNSFVKFLAPW